MSAGGAIYDYSISPFSTYQRRHYHDEFRPRAECNGTFILPLDSAELTISSPVLAIYEAINESLRFPISARAMKPPLCQIQATAHNNTVQCHYYTSSFDEQKSFDAASFPT